MPVKILREQINIPNLELNYLELFELIKSSMSDLGYDVDDTSYKYQKKGDMIKQVQSLIEGVRIMDSYTRFIIKVEITIDKAQTIKKNGKTYLKGKNGKVVLLSLLDLDYDQKWAKDPILHFLKGIYEKYVYLPIRKDYEVKVTKDLYHIKNSIRGLLNI